jgi:signal transduction histidine kinase
MSEVPVVTVPRVRVVAMLAVVGAVLGAIVLVLTASGRHETSTTTWFSGTVGGLYLAAGVIAALRQPSNRVGLLMVLVGIGWFAEDLQISIDPLTHSIGLLTRSVATGFLVHLVLAFPDGRLRSRTDRVLVASAYTAVFGLVPLSTVVYLTPTRNVLLIHPVVGLHEVINAVQVSVAAVVVVVLLGRWITATPPARRVLAPVFVTGLIGAVVSVLGPLFPPTLGKVLLEMGHAAVILLPLAFLAGVWRVRLGRTNVADLLLHLRQSAPGELENLLGRALGDRSLRVGYYRSDQDDYVDRDGRPLEPALGQAMTEVERNGRLVAALMHDPALREDRHVLQAVTSAAALELDNQRLAAEVRAQLVEVRASRARIIAAGDEQRRRLEHNLHDGAQQQLVILSLLLRSARERLGSLPDGDQKLAELLERSAAGLEAALLELRELARGIHPAVLSHSGLAAALRALAARTPHPIELATTTLPRLPAPVEATAYFVAAEAVTNALKHAKSGKIRIDFELGPSDLRLTVADDGVGGADPTNGTGLTGLRDRVSALDGEWTITSAPGAGTTVTVMLPVKGPR